MSFDDSNLTDETNKISFAICQNRDPFVQGITSVIQKHLKRKNDVFKIFLGYLSDDKHLEALIDMVAKPEEPCIKIYLVYNSAKGQT